MLMQDNSSLNKKFMFLQENSSFSKSSKFCKIVSNWLIFKTWKVLQEFSLSYLQLEKSQIIKIDDKGQTYMKISKEWPRHHFCRFFLTFFFMPSHAGAKDDVTFTHKKKLRTSVVRKNGLALNFVQCQKWWEK